MRRAALLLVSLLLVARPVRAVVAEPPSPGPPPPAVPAPMLAVDLTADTTWSGEVRLDRRVTVHEGATLRIARGTRVVVPLAAQGAVDAARPGLEVVGGLVADGDAEAPIRFEPEAGPPRERRRGDGVWLGILVHPGSGLPVRLAHVLIAEADYGFQPGRSGASAVDCAFHACGSGVGVGALWEGRDRLIRFVPDVAPRIEGCRFGACYVGVTLELDARPYVRRCVFHRCRTGVGNARPGKLYAQTGLGPYVDRCEFFRCGVAVQGASRVTHSIFEGNELVFEGSPFGERCLTSIDRFVRNRNLYTRNARLVRSDVPIGAGPGFLAPKRRGVLPDELGPEGLLGPLDAVLGLATGSPGIGYAADGGDLGAFGAAGATRGASPAGEGPSGLGVTTYLLLGPPSPGLFESLPSLAADVARRERLAGDAEGDASWATLDAGDLEDDDRSRRTASLFSEPRVLLAQFVATEVGRVTLRIGYDGTLEAWWNGEPVAAPKGPRRFLADDVSLPVILRKGTNALLLRHTPRTTTGRCVARLLRKDGGGGPDGVEAATVARDEETPAPAPVAGVTLTRETGRLGKMTGRATLRISLAGPVRWREALDRGRYRLTDGKGLPIDLADAALRYLPKERAVVFEMPSAPAPGGWTLVVSGLRRPTGEPFAVDPQSLPVRRP